jgi:hypothetical protein
VKVQLEPNRFRKDGEFWAAEITDAARLEWIEHWARIYRNSITREERIAAYRASEGKNLKYGDTYGWPEHF